MHYSTIKVSALNTIQDLDCAIDAVELDLVNLVDPQGDPEGALCPEALEVAAALQLKLDALFEIAHNECESGTPLGAQEILSIMFCN